MIQTRPAADAVACFPVVGQRRTDPLAIARRANFRLGQRRDVPLDDVTRNRAVAPFCVEQKTGNVIFVETRSDDDLREAAFCFQAQRKHARRLYAVPIGQALAAARGLRRPDKTILLHSVGRCGSTFLTRLFGRHPACRALSEPDIYSQLMLDGDVGAGAVELLSAVTAMYARPGGTTEPGAFVLKPRSFCVELAEPIYQATHTPESPHIALFLYRDVHHVIESSMRNLRYRGGPLWAFELAHRSRLGRLPLAGLIKANFATMRRLVPLVSGYSSLELANNGPVGMMTLAWLSAMHRYLALRAKGFPIVAVRYDDMKSSPASVFGSILRHCELDVDTAAASAEFNSDSQRGTAIARDKTRPWQITDRHRAVIARLLADHPVIRTGDHVLPGGIT